MTVSHDLPGRTWRDWLGLAARLAAGAVLLISGILKARSFAGSVNATKAYQLLPDWLAEVVGYALPIVEILVGLMLLVGLFTRFSAILEVVLMLVFIGGIASVWARGLSIDCGCFGGGGENAAVTWRTYLWEIIRDSAFLLPGLYLAFRPRTPYAVDEWLFRDPTADHYDDDLED